MLYDLNSSRGSYIPLNLKIMIQIILFLLGLYHFYLTFIALRDCIDAGAVKAAWNQVIVMFINFAYIGFILYTI